jgi:RimJ/RimL family protein N-acetyltransferase
LRCCIFGIRQARKSSETLLLVSAERFASFHGTIAAFRLEKALSNLTHTPLVSILGMRAGNAQTSADSGIWIGARSVLSVAANENDKGSNMVAHEDEHERWQSQHIWHWSDHHHQSGRRGSSDSVLLPELRGARVRLRPLEQGDEVQLHIWATDTREISLWREECRVEDFKTFARQLHASLLASEPHMIVEGLHSGRMIGWAYGDQVSTTHQRCRMHVYVIPEARRYGAGAEAGILFLDFLFGWLGMHKVFAEPLLAQSSTIQLASHWGFQVEGILREERRAGCQYHDTARLAFHRARWQETITDDNEDVSYRLKQVRGLRQTHEMFFPNRDDPQHL